MAGSPKEKLLVHDEQEETVEHREVFLRDGRTLVVSDEGNDQLVEIRNESGMLEVRIKLTAEGPVLQMESVRLQLKASEAVEIESKRVEIKATEQLALEGKAIEVHADEDLELEADGEVRVVGKMIYLN
jgi:phage gp45-like